MRLHTDLPDAAASLTRGFPWRTSQSWRGNRHMGEIQLVAPPGYWRFTNWVGALGGGGGGLCRHLPGPALLRGGGLAPGPDYINIFLVNLPLPGGQRLGAKRTMTMYCVSGLLTARPLGRSPPHPSGDTCWGWNPGTELPGPDTQTPIYHWEARL